MASTEAMLAFIYFLECVVGKMLVWQVNQHLPQWLVDLKKELTLGPAGVPKALLSSNTVVCVSQPPW